MSDVHKASHSQSEKEFSKIPTGLIRHEPSTSTSDGHYRLQISKYSSLKGYTTRWRSSILMAVIDIVLRLFLITNECRTNLVSLEKTANCLEFQGRVSAHIEISHDTAVNKRHATKHVHGEVMEYSESSAYA